MGGGVYIKSCQLAYLFKAAPFRANTKTRNILVREELFADDSALLIHSAEEIKRIIDAFMVNPDYQIAGQGDLYKVS